MWGSQRGVDFAQDTGGTSSLAMIGGIKTLDTSVIGAILCGSLLTWIHNRFYSTKLPDYVSIFQGAAFVNIIGFSVMLPLALLTLWPKVQLGMVSLQRVCSRLNPAGHSYLIFPTMRAWADRVR